MERWYKIQMGAVSISIVVFSVFFFTLFPVYGELFNSDEQRCLKIASPPDFYYNTVLLSWTPIYEADSYIFEYKIGLEQGSLQLNENWLKLIAIDRVQWEIFVSVGTLNYRVYAIDASENIIEGPTDWAEFTCYSYRTGNYYSSENNYISNDFNDSDCMRASNPPDFYYNTILLSWTPVSGVSHYKLDLLVFDRLISIDIEDNWFRIVADTPLHWEFLVKLASIAYVVTAYDADGIVIAGPSEPSLFIKL